MSRPTFGSYLRYLTKPFFLSWWVTLSGFASVLALFITPAGGVKLGGIAVASLCLLGFTLAFLIFSVVAQGWNAYAKESTGLKVASIERVRDSKEGWLLIIEGNVEVSVGAVIDVYRRTGVVEVPFALVRVTEKNSAGAYQAMPIGGVNPVHIREHNAGSLRSTDLVVRSFVEMRRLREIANEFTREDTDDLA